MIPFLKTRAIAMVSISAALSVGCSQTSAAEQAEASSIADEASVDHSEHEAVLVSAEILRRIGDGDFSGAAALTDEADRMMRQIQQQISRYGLEQTKQRGREALAEQQIRLVSESGDYAMVLVENPNSDYSPVSSEIYKRGEDGTYKAVLLPGPHIPCDLVREFFEEKGSPEEEAPCTVYDADGSIDPVDPQTPSLQN